MSDARSGDARIRSFSRIVWTVGSIVITIVAVLVFPRIYLGPAGDLYVEGGGIGYERTLPWLEDDPVELEIVDGRIRGDRDGGVLPLASSSDPLVLRGLGTDDIGVGVRQSVDAGDAADTDLPASIGWLYSADDEVFLLPGRADGLVWFSSEDPAWEVTVDPVRTQPITDSVSGTGDAVLAYRGDALSARFVHEGAGIFRVTIAAPGETTLAVNEVDDVSERASWREPGVVLFLIEAAGGDGEWTVTTDE